MHRQGAIEAKNRELLGKEEVSVERMKRAQSLLMDLLVMSESPESMG